MSQGSELESGNVTDKKPRPKRAPMEIYKIGALSKIRSAKSNQQLKPEARLEKCLQATNLEEFKPLENKRKDQLESKSSCTNVTPVVKTVNQSVEKSDGLRSNPSSDDSRGKVLYKSNQKMIDCSYIKNQDDPLPKETKVCSTVAKSININVKKETDKFNNEDRPISKVNQFSTAPCKSFKSRSYSSNTRANKLETSANLPRLTELNLQDPTNTIDISDKNRSRAVSTMSVSQGVNEPDLKNADLEDVYFSNQNNESLQFKNAKIKDDQSSQYLYKRPGRSKPANKSNYGNENKFNSMNEKNCNVLHKNLPKCNKDTVLNRHYDNDKVIEASSSNRNKSSKNVKKQSDCYGIPDSSNNTEVFNKLALIKHLENQQPHLSVSDDTIDKLTLEKYKNKSPLRLSKEDFGGKVNNKKCFKSFNRPTPEKIISENKYELEADDAEITQKECISQNLHKEGNNKYCFKGKPTSVAHNKNTTITDIKTYSNKEERLSESCPLELTEEQVISKSYYLKIDDLSDETSSLSQDSENDSKLDNPMTYIDFQDNLCKNSVKKNLLATPKNKYSAKTLDMNSICWGDEKWSPALRSKKKMSKQKVSEANFPESPGRRGIIQIGNSSSPMLQLYDSSHNIPNIQNVGQKLLFNPSNPSKPVAVTPCARDLPSSWDNVTNSDEKNEGDEVMNVDRNLVDASSESGSKVDPSICYSIQRGECDINYYVGSNQIPQEFRRIMNIRKHLQNCYYQLLVTDIRYCQDKNIENALWKSLYYVIIEKLREYIAREPTLKERSTSTLLMLVDDGLDYLQKLLKELQNAYCFSLDDHMDEDLMTLPGTKNRVRLALFSCQKILLCLGDLARYKERTNPSPNFNSAKSWYEKALQVHPRNGRPFNQLAIIAVSQKRPLDVVYYYIRSLTAANPFTSARDSLISMYDDIRKKYESMEKLPSHPNYKNILVQQEDMHSVEKSGRLRQETWIRPDNGAHVKRTLTQSDQEEERNALITELMQFPPDQLMKHFLTAFLHCHGILFSRVGAEHFTDVLADTLNLFYVLMKLSPSRLSPTHLLQIMAVNMFAVDNTQLRGSVAEGELRSAYQANALLLAQEMFARLVETMVSLFPKNFNCSPNSNNDGGKSSFKHNKRDSRGLFIPQLAQYVQAAKVWCDWLLYQSSTWNPPAISDSKLGLDTWGIIGELATIVKGIGSPDVTLLEDGPRPNIVPVVLPEDSFLRGYTPLLNAHRKTYYVPKGTSLERARDWVRICKFQLCLSQFLCGVEPPVLRLQKTDQGEILVPIVAETPPVSPSIRKQRETLSTSEDAEMEDSFSDLESPDEDDTSAMIKDETPIEKTLRALGAQKKNLERKHRQQKRMQVILEGSVTLEIEVRPRYLVPDTNCFIEHLDVIKALIKSDTYTLMVPLVVMSELDGLSRDTAVEKYGDAVHAINVREGAAAALHYIRSTKHSQLKCVTSQGSILSSTMFTSEIDSQPDVTNDDKILSCCLQYCGDIRQRREIKKGVKRLYREVVLLTEDRNLRVKAHSRDVPVRDLLDFAHWAGIK